MVIELPEELEPALKMQANAHGVSVAGYVRTVIERELGPSISSPSQPKPFKTSYGACANLGPGPSAEEIDQNRAEMSRNFGEAF
jgi:plasmid stability protein